ncbi:hypothetical protein AURDEDRAFT_165924 [Auricularia subglabra TFB-10046 SS5]|nr:hypothetical protein AURDEDRAFT_165924 [Auricularia subglabra TFB-10046 SS5]
MFDDEDGLPSLEDLTDDGDYDEDNDEGADDNQDDFDVPEPAAQPTSTPPSRAVVSQLGQLSEKAVGKRRAPAPASTPAPQQQASSSSSPSTPARAGPSGTSAGPHRAVAEPAKAVVTNGKRPVELHLQLLSGKWVHVDIQVKNNTLTWPCVSSKLANYFKDGQTSLDVFFYDRKLNEPFGVGSSRRVLPTQQIVLARVANAVGLPTDLVDEEPNVDDDVIEISSDEDEVAAPKPAIPAKRRAKKELPFRPLKMAKRETDRSRQSTAASPAAPRNNTGHTRTTSTASQRSMPTPSRSNATPSRRSEGATPTRRANASSASGPSRASRR